MHQKVIVTLAAAMMVLFLLTAGFDPEFFFFYFYQAAIYLAIILLFFYFEDRWAYMFGILAPILWLFINFATGLLSAQARQVYRLLSMGSPSNPTTLLGALITGCGIALAILSYRAFHKEIMGTRHARPTFWGSLVVVLVYYAVLVYWFMRAAAG